ncbi:PREDICTED: uncharacterized protein LOC104812632 [Tarenaya hassleriana]|uniref:uncharacterized protein LOC104812632 n=1 Tax=Tarenaya hassleriana TaxID=28532 RepID=UPI00053C7622|nr:PREDICTED: uncharacterized protein LOC104812632 [Tarenaya hassleriana]
MASFNHIESAKLLWDTLKDVYGNTSNISRIYEVKRRIYSLRQEERSFNALLGEFTALWSEFRELRQPSTVAKEMENHEQDKTFALLFALNSSYKELIQTILRESTLPSFNEVCSRVKKEEGGKTLFSGPSELAHHARGNLGDHGEIAQKAVGFKPGGERRTPFCDYCKRKGHTKDKCWALHPHLKPQRFANSQYVSDKARFAGESSIEILEAGGKTNHDAALNASISGFVTKSEMETMLQGLTSNISKMIASKDFGY